MQINLGATCKARTPRTPPSRAPWNCQRCPCSTIHTNHTFFPSRYSPKRCTCKRGDYPTLRIRDVVSSWISNANFSQLVACCGHPAPPPFPLPFPFPTHSIPPAPFPSPFPRCTHLRTWNPSLKSERYRSEKFARYLFRAPPEINHMQRTYSTIFCLVVVLVVDVVAVASRCALNGKSST